MLIVVSDFKSTKLIKTKFLKGATVLLIEIRFASTRFRLNFKTSWVGAYN